VRAARTSSRDGFQRSGLRISRLWGVDERIGSRWVAAAMGVESVACGDRMSALRESPPSCYPSPQPLRPVL
jgi:hypothetical protein